MKACVLTLLFLLATSAYADRYYKDPGFKLKTHVKPAKVQKETDYKGLKVNDYKVDEKPARKRNLASKKNGGRLPSSKTIEHHEYKVEPWFLEKLK